MTTIALLNPNTDAAATRRMVAVAQAACPAEVQVIGFTAPLGAPLITDERQLAEAAPAVVALASQLGGRFGGAIVAGFGDPGLSAARDVFSGPIVGIGESAIRKAADGGRRFAVATTTPDMVAHIERGVAALGVGGQFEGVFLTEGNAIAVTGDADRLVRELARALAAIAARTRSAAIVIGGGPLADAAKALQAPSGVEIVEPIPVAVQRLLVLVAERSAQ